MILGYWEKSKSESSAGGGSGGYRMIFCGMGKKSKNRGFWGGQSGDVGYAILTRLKVSSQ